MDLSTGCRVGYDIDSLLGAPSTSNVGVDDDRISADIRDRNYFSTGSNYTRKISE